MVNKLVEECNETIDELKLTENENSYKCHSCICYIVLFSILFIINAGIGVYFAYYKYRTCNKKNVSRYYDCLSDNNLINKLINGGSQTN